MKSEFRSALLLLLFVVAGLTGCNRHHGRKLDLNLIDRVDRSYQGRFSERPELARLTSDAPRMLKEAAQRVEERIGLRTPNPDNIALMFVDRDNKTQGFDPKSFAQTGTFIVDGKPLEVIRISLDSYFSIEMDLEKTLTHEYVHAVMREQMKKRYRKIPKWFREGVAVWTAGQVEDKLRACVAISVWNDKKPNHSITGIDNPHLANTAYIEAGLAFEYLEKSIGTGKLKSLIKETVDGGYFLGVLQKIAGEAFVKLKPKLRKYAENRIQKSLKGQGYEEYQPISAMMLADKYQEALHALQQLTKKYPESWLQPIFRYRIGTCLNLLGNWKEAVKVLETVIKKHPEAAYLHRECMQRIAYCHLRAGSLEKARSVLDRLFEAYRYLPDTRLFTAIHFSGLTFLAANDFESAAKALSKVYKLKKHWFAPEACLALTAAYEKLGKANRAAETKSFCDSSYPSKN